MACLPHSAIFAYGTLWLASQYTKAANAVQMAVTMLAKHASLYITACPKWLSSPVGCASLPLFLQAIMQAAQLKADGKAQRVIVTGCLAQRYSEDLAGKCMIIMYISDLRPRLPMQLEIQLLIIGSCFTVNCLFHSQQCCPLTKTITSPCYDVWKWASAIARE